MTDERIQQLTIELAMLIATAADPAAALRRHQDGLVEELVAARRNLAGSAPFVEAVREAVGLAAGAGTRTRPAALTRRRWRRAS